MNALRNRSFRHLLLGLVGLAVVGADLAQTAGLVLGDAHYRPNDLFVYVDAARRLAAGADPYATFLTSDIPDPTLNQGYIYPPFLAWSLQPVAALPDAAIALLAILALHGLLVAGVLLVTRRLGLGWEAALWTLVAALAWFPTRQNLVGAQVNLALMFLVAVWLTRPARLPGAIALGVAGAVKFLTLPLLAYLALRRRRAGLGVAGATCAACWVLPAPGHLPEYVTRVLPSLGAGSGFRENLAPLATILRLADPATVFGQTGPPSAGARAAAMLIGLAVIGLAAWRIAALPAPGRDSRGELLEAAAAVTVIPLIASIVWPSHLVLLIPSLIVLATAAVRTGDRILVALVLAGCVLTGPVRSGELSLIALGVHSGAVLRPLAETGVVATVLFFWAGLRALRHRQAWAPLR